MINGTIKHFTPIVSYVNKLFSQTPSLISFGLFNHSHSMPEISKINVIFVLGPPGSGNGITGIHKLISIPDKFVPKGCKNIK